ncbi:MULTISPECIES: hypothetical protein [unclassified Arthrobacter]|uniref:hypothetical protein n=1 Tax=unclassified Arthrobacter TaxID=235627 RepID=UPI0011B0870B|nr:MULTISPECIES: hypothetical protein [unclassified Arthrobacter]
MRKDPQTPAELPVPDGHNAVEAAPVKGDITRPVGVYVIAVVVGLEALALAVMGVWSLLSLLTQPSHSVTSGIFLTVLIFGLAAGLAGVAVNAFKGMRWTRSAAFVWQLLMMAIGVPALLEGQIPLGLLLLLPPLATAYFLFTPKVVEFSLRKASNEAGESDESGESEGKLL